ncbi:hypothetical protein C6P45_004566 [Maudiozyma exigua]|uniref:SEC7 domain-containing protein n=1 Tax=Maudiozyma exigua TaxID=34358 RepID=A0A9P7BBI5_MAUEX|nr:hypothetical protein C6P45_004566 [Kazachstania exigua]
MSQSITSRIKSKFFQGNGENTTNNSSQDTNEKDFKETPTDRIGSLPTMDFTNSTNNDNTYNSTVTDRQELNTIAEVNPSRLGTPNEITNETKDDDLENTTSEKPVTAPHNSSRIRRLKNRMFDINFRSSSRSVSKEMTPKTPEQQNNNSITDTEEEGLETEDSHTKLQQKDPSYSPVIPTRVRPIGRNSFTDSPYKSTLEKFPTKETVPLHANDMYRTLSETSACSSQDNSVRPGRNHSRHPSTTLNLKSTEKRKSISPPFKLYNVTALRNLRSNDDKIELPKYSLDEEEQIITPTQPTAPKASNYSGVTRRRSKTVDVYDTLKRTRASVGRQSRIPGATVTRSNSFKLNDNHDMSNVDSIVSAKSYSVLSPERSASSGVPISRRSTDLGTTRYSSHNIPNLQNSNTNSTFSISKRSNSIVNALSSFVNLRSGSSSSNKHPQIQNYEYQSSITTPIRLTDLPTPPEHKENESYENYLKRLSGYGKFVSVILTEKPDDYKLGCLRFFLTEYFEFAMDPLDIALRKLLIFLELPKEAQQIDRLLTEFAKVYYEKQKSYYGANCPWTNHNQVYFVIFSLLMLHTDYFNPNNKQKMTRQEFINLVHEDTYSEGDKVPLEILAYYYDNIIGKESPKFDFSTYYSMLNTPTSSSLELQNSDNNSSSEGNSKSSVLPYSADTVLSSAMTKSSMYTTEEERINRDNNKTLTILDETDGIIYSPKAIIQQNKIFNSRRTSRSSNNAIMDLDDTAANALTQDYTSAVPLKGRPSSNSISSYFSNTNMTPTPIPSSNTFSTLTPSGASGNTFLSAYKSNSTSNEVKDDIDIYYHIFNDDLFEISMTLHVVKLMPHDFSTYNVTPQHNEDNKYKKYYDIYREFKGAYLRIPKNHLGKLNIPNYEIINPNIDPTGNQILKSKPKYYYLKVIKMGEIEEMSSNNSWRAKTVLLTNCGILIYDSNKSGHHHTLIPSGSIFSDSSELFSTEAKRDKSTGESYYTVNFRSGFAMLFNNGLYAEPVKEDTALCNNVECPTNEAMKHKDYPFILWGSHGKSVWRCITESDRTNWIDSINLVGCLYGTMITYRSLHDTIACKEDETIGHRYYNMQIENQKIIEQFSAIEKELILFKQSIPVSFKTRNDMISNIISLSARSKRLIRDYRRNDCYGYVIESLDLVKDINPEDESESAIQTSALSDERGFSINDESLHTCVTENSRDSIYAYHDAVNDTSSNATGQRDLYG